MKILVKMEKLARTFKTFRFLKVLPKTLKLLKISNIGLYNYMRTIWKRDIYSQLSARKGGECYELQIPTISNPFKMWIQSPKYRISDSTITPYNGTFPYFY